MPDGSAVGILAIDPKTPQTLYAGTFFYGVFKTTDGGSNWNELNAGLTDTRVEALAIDPMAPQTVYASTWAGIFKLVPGPFWDTDADGKADIAVWRPSTAFGTHCPATHPATTPALRGALRSDISVPGDYDGDGKSDVAVWRPSNGVWYIRPSGTTGTYTANAWGISADIPVPGDYDGDGKD